jgi:hypothetical protein
MGLERVRIALLRGFDIPRGPMREDALDWVKEQEERQERRQFIILVATIVAAVGAWVAALAVLTSRLWPQADSSPDVPALMLSACPIPLR